MTYRNRLTADQVREIRSLHHQGISDYAISDRLEIPRITVNKVTRRQTYRDVMDIAGSTETCPCLRHTEARLQQVNLNRAAGAQLQATCLACRLDRIAPVAEIQSAEGRFICDTCRRKS